MSDAVCRRCGEPWDLYYLAHEALYDYPGDSAPDYVHDAHSELVELLDRHHAEGTPKPDHYGLGGHQLQNDVLRGAGCPACWENPARVHDNEDASIDALRHNLFDSNWDGDPAELF